MWILTVSSQQGGASGIIHDDIYKDEAVAGPSGINTRHLVSSTPNIQSTATHLLAGTDRKMNGKKNVIIINFKWFSVKMVSVKFHLAVVIFSAVLIIFFNSSLKVCCYLDLHDIRGILFIHLWFT